MMMVHLENGAYVVGRVPAGVFEASDGHITILMYRDEEFPKLCDLLDLPEMGANPRYATNAQRVEHEVEIMPDIMAAFRQQTCADLSAKLTDARILHERVNSFIEFLDHPQVQETGLVSWIDHAGVGRVPLPNVPGLPAFKTVGTKAHAPAIGEHSGEVLEELGYSADEIAGMVTRKVTLA